MRRKILNAYFQLFFGKTWWLHFTTQGHLPNSSVQHKGICQTGQLRAELCLLKNATICSIHVNGVIFSCNLFHLVLHPLRVCPKNAHLGVCHLHLSLLVGDWCSHFERCSACHLWWPFLNHVALCHAVLLRFPVLSRVRLILAVIATGKNASVRRDHRGKHFCNQQRRGNFFSVDRAAAEIFEVCAATAAAIFKKVSRACPFCGYVLQASSPPPAPFDIFSIMAKKGVGRQKVNFCSESCIFFHMLSRIIQLAWHFWMH